MENEYINDELHTAEFAAEDPVVISTSEYAALVRDSERLAVLKELNAGLDSYVYRKVSDIIFHKQKEQSDE